MNKIKKLNKKPLNMKWNQLIKKRLAIKLSVLTASAFFCAVAIQYFIIPATTVPTEIMGITMGMVSTIFIYDTRNYLILFWTLYFVALLPFFIFSWFKVSKSLTYYTTFFVVMNTIFGLIFSALPLKAATWQMFGSWYAIYSNHHKFLGFLLRFAYSTLGTIFYASGAAFLWLFGASTGGTDFVVKYISNKKKLHISVMLTVFAVSTLIIATLIFELVGIQHDYLKIPYSKISYIQLLITFSISVWQCTFGPLVIFFIYNEKRAAKCSKPIFK